MDLIQHHTDESLKEGSNLIGHRAVAFELSQPWCDPYVGSRYIDYLDLCDENLVEPITEPLYNDWEQELHDALERDTENDIIMTPH